MEIFLALIVKIIPLYFLILLGFFAGRYLKAQKETIARLLIYLIAPIVVFHGVAAARLNPKLLILPVLFFILSSVFCIIFYKASRLLFKDSTRNIFAFAAATGNTGYFGYPLVIALLGPEFLGIAVLANFGLIFFENSLGFFITAKGNHTGREAFARLLKLPSLYAFLAALALNFLGLNEFTANPIYTNFAGSFLGAYTILGMMIIGFGLAEMHTVAFDFKFISATFFAKFLMWPLVMTALIKLDAATIHWLTVEASRVIFIMSLVPLAANTVSFATLLNAHPQKAAQAVFLSTLFALFYIPLITIFFLRN